MKFVEAGIQLLESRRNTWENYRKENINAIPLAKVPANDILEDEEGINGNDIKTYIGNLH